jgi:outer membrane protein TolC
LDTAKKQLQLESIPEMDVMRAEAEVSRRDQDLTVARTTLQLQELLIKNALTKSLDDPVLEAMPVIPTDRLESTQPAASRAVQDLIAQALQDRPELAESDVDLVNRQISNKAATERVVAVALAGGILRRIGIGWASKSGFTSVAGPPTHHRSPRISPARWRTHSITQLRTTTSD